MEMCLVPLGAPTLAVFVDEFLKFLSHSRRRRLAFDEVTSAAEKITRNGPTLTSGSTKFFIDRLVIEAAPGESHPRRLVCVAGEVGVGATCTHSN